MLEERPDWKVAAEAADGRDAVRQAQLLRPDVAILDVAMPLLNGVEAMRQIVKHVPGVRVPPPNRPTQNARATSEATGSTNIAIGRVI